jgi:hypothetical protein
MTDYLYYNIYNHEKTYKRMNHSVYSSIRICPCMKLVVFNFHPLLSLLQLR